MSPGLRTLTGRQQGIQPRERGRWSRWSPIARSYLSWRRNESRGTAGQPGSGRHDVRAVGPGDHRVEVPLGDLGQVIGQPEHPRPGLALSSVTTWVLMITFLRSSDGRRSTGQGSGGQARPQ